MCAVSVTPSPSPLALQSADVSQRGPHFASRNLSAWYHRSQLAVKGTAAHRDAFALLRTICVPNHHFPCCPCCVALQISYKEPTPPDTPLVVRSKVRRALMGGGQALLGVAGVEKQARKCFSVGREVQVWEGQRWAASLSGAAWVRPA